MSREFTYGVGLQTYCGGRWDEGSPTLKELGEFAQAAEKLGYTHIWHTDRFLPLAHPAYNTTFYDPLVTLSAILPYLRQARIGTSALVLPTKNPVLLSKQLATLDLLSGGRLTIGFGMGWSQQEFQALNADFPRRSSIYDEYLRVVRLLLSEESASFQGRYWSFTDLSIQPRPVQKPRPPIYLGGGGPWIGIDDAKRERLERRVLRRIATLADGWIIGTRTDPETAVRQLGLMRKFLEEAGKDPERFMVANQNFVYITGVSGTLDQLKARLPKILATPLDTALRVSIVGSREEVEQRIGRMVQAGVRHFIAWPVGNDYATIEYLAKEVFPKYQK